MHARLLGAICLVLLLRPGEEIVAKAAEQGEDDHKVKREDRC